MSPHLKKNLAKVILYSGWGILFLLGFLIPNAYTMVFRALGALISMIGVVLLLITSRRRDREVGNRS